MGKVRVRVQSYIAFLGGGAYKKCHPELVSGSYPLLDKV